MQGAAAAMLPRWARVGTPVRHGRVPLAGRPLPLSVRSSAGEHSAWDRGAAGSIPAIGTKFYGESTYKVVGIDC